MNAEKYTLTVEHSELKLILDLLKENRNMWMKKAKEYEIDDDLDMSHHADIKAATADELMLRLYVEANDQRKK